jgi:Mg-chelatase subunit ChlD
MALLLLLFLPLLWTFTLLTLRAGGRQAAKATKAAKAATRADRGALVVSWRPLSSLVVRTVIFVALVLALAGTQVVRPVRDLAVVFLVDGSDSVTPDQREWAIDYINQALAARQPADQAAIVVFGQNALVERVPSRLDTIARLTSTPIGNRTSIASAIQLGLALLPTDTQKRLVLLSDGEENAGSATETARLAAVRDIPVDVVPLPSTSGADVLVSSLDAPDTAREGQTLTLQAALRSNIETTGRLQVFADGELVGTQEVAISPGTTTVPLTVPGGEQGFHRYEVRLEARDDTRAVNNRAAAFTTVQGPPRVLLIASDPARAGPLQRVLEASQARVELLAPDRVPAEQAQLKRYAAILLVDVLAHDVPDPLKEALPIYVREQGGSLAMIGGRESFGAGGWRRSPVAEALPVILERKDTLRRPDLGLVLVIDRSGSMSEGGDGVAKLDLAKEAVYQATLGLEQTDQLGIVAFDTFADWVLPVQPLPNLLDIQRALSMLIADGGTNIRSGIEPAAQALTTVDARVKHVILLTDGQAESNYADLIDQMHADGITISVVSIGTDANPALQQIAERGGGRYYRVHTIAEIPRIFLAETVKVAGRDIVEETFIPVVALPAPIVRGLERIPPLHGYNATEARPSARTILVTPEGHPLLAQWQYGLGRGVAWTSDLKGQWAREWMTWEQFSRFGGDLLDMLLPPQQAEGLSLEARTEGHLAVFDLTIQNPGLLQQAPHLEGRLLDPEDESHPLNFAQVGAGRYRATVPVDLPGSYLVQVAVVGEEGEAGGTVSGGLVVAYSPEYRPHSTNQSVLQEIARISGGQPSPAAPAVFEPTSQTVGAVRQVTHPLLWLALLLWPLDIALRRLVVPWEQVRALLERGRGWFRIRPRPRRRPPPPAEADVTMMRLRAARDRARRKSEHDREGRE